MTVGHALRQARIAAGLTQGALARDLFVSDSLISDWERGRTRVQKHMARQVLRRLPKAEVMLAIAHDALGTAFVSPILNGIDRHWACLTAMIEEDFRGLLDRSPAIRRAMFRRQLTQDDRQTVRDWLQGLIEARTKIDNAVAVACDVCEFNPEGLFEAHWRDMEARGYYEGR